MALKSNYRALSRAAPQQHFINDGDYMIDEKTQQPLGVASDLNAELGMACVGCISESKNELRCYDCKVTSSGKGSNFLAVESIVKPKPLKLRPLDAAMRFLGINSDND